MRVVSATEQQARTFPTIIIPSLSSEVLYRRVKPAISTGEAFAAPMLSKSLAQDTRTLQGRSAMSMSARSNNYGRAIVAAFVSVGFLWTLALSASSQLHQRVHPDANRVEHSCAATMIASGSYDHATHPLLISADALAHQFSKIPALRPCWVQSPFLGACIFEHAPPARG